MSDERASAGRLRLTMVGPEPMVRELDPAGGVPDPTAVRPPEAGQDPVEAPISPRMGRPVDLRRQAESRAGIVRYEAIVDGWRFEVEVESVARAILRERASGAGRRGAGSGRQVVRAQIPGRIVTVGVGVGEAVEAGQRLLSIEAMKMENAVIAPRAGTIAQVGVVAGQTVERGDELVVIE